MMCNMDDGTSPFVLEHLFITYGSFFTIFKGSFCLFNLPHYFPYNAMELSFPELFCVFN